MYGHIRACREYGVQVCRQHERLSIFCTGAERDDVAD